MYGQNCSEELREEDKVGMQRGKLKNHLGGVKIIKLAGQDKLD